MNRDSSDEHCVDIASVGERRLAQRRPLHPTLGQCCSKLFSPQPGSCRAGAPGSSSHLGIFPFFPPQVTP